MLLVPSFDGADEEFETKGARKRCVELFQQKVSTGDRCPRCQALQDQIRKVELNLELVCEGSSDQIKQVLSVLHTLLEQAKNCQGYLWQSPHPIPSINLKIIFLISLLLRSSAIFILDVVHWVFWTKYWPGEFTVIGVCGLLVHVFADNPFIHHGGFHVLLDQGYPNKFLCWLKSYLIHRHIQYGVRLKENRRTLLQKGGRIHADWLNNSKWKTGSLRLKDSIKMSR